MRFVFSPPTEEAAGLLTLPWTQPLEEWLLNTVCSAAAGAATKATGAATMNTNKLAATQRASVDGRERTVVNSHDPR